MLFRVLADLVLLLHLAFIVFVLLGGLFALRWRWIPWFHLPAVLWAVVLEFRGWICPLTPVENWLRQVSGEAGYSGGFIEHYLMSILYQQGLTPSVQWLLGCIVLFVNLATYAVVYSRKSNVS